MKRIYFGLAILFLLTKISLAKVFIFTHVYNRPDFIKIQYECFKKFLNDDYEFIVFNDATDTQLFNQIHETCNLLSLKCYDIPQRIHTNGEYQLLNSNKHLSNASIRNSNAVQYSLDVLGFNHNDILAIVDSDMFLVKPFSIRQHLGNYNISAWMRGQKVKYCWIGLVFLNMKDLPNKKTLNFSSGFINKQLVDSGGFTHYYLKENKKVKNLEINKYMLRDLFCDICKRNKNRVKNCQHNESLITSKLKYTSNTYISFTQSLYTGYDGRDVEFFLSGTFIHYRAGSNYNNKVSQSQKEYKDNCFKKFFTNLLN